MGQNHILHLSDHERITYYVWSYGLFSVSFEKKVNLIRYRVGLGEGGGGGEMGTSYPVTVFHCFIFFFNISCLILSNFIDSLIT